MHRLLPRQTKTHLSIISKLNKNKDKNVNNNNMKKHTFRLSVRFSETSFPTLTIIEKTNRGSHSHSRVVSSIHHQIFTFHQNLKSKRLLYFHVARRRTGKDVLNFINRWWIDLDLVIYCLGRYQWFTSGVIEPFIDINMVSE